jgi:hypothetical protein
MTSMALSGPAASFCSTLAHASISEDGVKPLARIVAMRREHLVDPAVFLAEVGNVLGLAGVVRSIDLKRSSRKA